MKLFIGGPYVYKDQKISGGVEAVLKNLTQGITIYEPDINLKIVSGSDQSHKNIEVDNDIIYIKHPKVKIGSVYLSSYPYRIKHFLQTSDFDILNDHSEVFSYYVRKTPEKLLLTLHGMPWGEKKYISTFKKPLYHVFYIKRLEKILKNLRYFISINPYSRELVEKKTKAEIYDICNPVPNELFELKNQSQENRFLYIGIISERKNLFTLVKALNIIRKKNKNFKLIVAGKIANQQYFDNILEYVKRNNLNDFFEYVGTITEKQKLDELSKMSFLVLPSFQETAPIVISEAFATGKPVIASNICGIPYMIDDGKNGFLIDPLNEADLSNKILFLMENPSAITSMGINGKKYAVEYHSQRVVVKKYRAVFEEMLSNL